MILINYMDIIHIASFSELSKRNAYPNKPFIKYNLYSINKKRAACAALSPIKQTCIINQDFYHSKMNSNYSLLNYYYHLLPAH